MPSSNSLPSQIWSLRSVQFSFVHMICSSPFSTFILHINLHLKCHCLLWCYSVVLKCVRVCLMQVSQKSLSPFINDWIDLSSYKSPESGLLSSNSRCLKSAMIIESMKRNHHFHTHNICTLQWKECFHDWQICDNWTRKFNIGFVLLNQHILDPEATPFPPKHLKTTHHNALNAF